MVRRIEINEPVEIRELSEAKGRLGIYSLDKKEFLKLDGEEIALEKKDALVLPEGHKLEKLDLTRKAGKEATLDLLIVENHGKSIELSGDDLAVIGRAAVKTSAYDLAGIDSEALKDKHQIAATGSYVDSLLDTEVKGRVFHYGKEKNIAVLHTGLGGRIDFVNTENKKLFTLASGEDQGVAHGRLLTLEDGDLPQPGKERQPGVMQHLQNALKIQDEGKRESALQKLGAPEELLNGLPAGDYAIQPLDRLRKRYPAIKEENAREEEKAKALMRDMPDPLIPDGREKAKTARVSIQNESGIQSEFDAQLARGLDPQIAMAVAKMQYGRSSPKEADHNSIQAPPDIPKSPTPPGQKARA